MSLETLAFQLLNDPRLRRTVLAIASRSVFADMPLVRPVAPVSAIDWAWALMLASALAGVASEPAQEVALRISQGCLASLDSEEGHRVAASVILERMGNRRALDLAVKRETIPTDAWSRSPGPLMLDVIRKRLELTIRVRGGREIAANPFQRSFWDAASKHRWVSVSASTSAGKSFIVRAWIAHQAAVREHFRAAYVVPTRALIDEVSNELEVELAGEVDVYTIPWDGDIGSGNREIYVMTQERLHLLLSGDPALVLDVVFVDEAQKFGDDQRGVLLQQVLDEITRRRGDVQVLLASPLTANPQVLLESAPREAGTPIAINSEAVTVNQNLLWADQLPRKPREWQLQLVSDGEPQPTGLFSLSSNPSPASQRLPLVAVALAGERPGTVIYVSLPRDAEKASIQIHGALGASADVTSDPEIAALRDLVQRTVHPQYALGKALERGVGFHYGSMPQLIRHEIERLFRAEKIRYLVCTSTLMEGVNLPCRMLVARGPQKGNGRPMSSADFWNLAGRAGRWGKEFQGNIVCVDASREKVWPEPPRRRERQQLVRATDARLGEPEKILSYIQRGAPAATARADEMLEAMFSFLTVRRLAGQPLAELPGLDAIAAGKLELAIDDALATVSLPPELLARHAGVGVLAMQRLLDHFRSADSWQQFMLPSASSLDAADAYSRALGVCHEELGADFVNDKRQFALALLITGWMRGFPLAVLISHRLNYLRRVGRSFKLATEIRSVMRDVERVARFEAPKYLGCYLDVLKWHLAQIGERQIAADMFDIGMMLELGVTRTTEMSLMALGLSRTSAIAIAEFITDDDLSRDGCLDWLRNHEVEGLDVPVLVQEEVLRRLQRT